MRALTPDELEAGLEDILGSPKDEGVVELIVRRPRVGEREVLDVGALDLVDGLVGDSWRKRRGFKTPNGEPNPEMQLNVMNSRVIALVAETRDRWQLAGDQLYIDLDLSAANLPPGTRLAVGQAVIEVTAVPHTGCEKFRARFGGAAIKLVNSKIGREHNLRGINAKVVRPGAVRGGDTVKKLPR
ncbi:MAG: MOSC domain-containing protein [Candidatus Binatia bacterium]